MLTTMVAPPQRGATELFRLTARCDAGCERETRREWLTKEGACGRLWNHKAARVR